MKKWIYILIGCVACACSNNQTAESKTLVFDTDTFGDQPATVEIEPQKTAIIVVDMWNYHWCMTATERVSAMVPRMNKVLDIARQLGMQVVWNPSDVVTSYAGYPQYEKAVAVARRKSPELRPDPDVTFTAPINHCMCGQGIHCGENYGWDGMHPDLVLHENDLIAAATDEIYTLLSDRNIENIIYMGVHTNMCVYGKPGALSHMWRAGFNCLLARDLNDAITIYDPIAGFTPDDGTTETDANLHLAGIPNINLGEAFQKMGLWKEKLPIDYVRFAPWGNPDRPYFIDSLALVTLTAPWTEADEIRYTTDGSTPTTQSARYTEPLHIAQTCTVRAMAFRKGKPVSLPASAYYAKLPSLPPQPDVYLETLPYLTNAYLEYIPTSLWFPVKGKSFEEKPLRIRHKTYTHGMGFRAPASVQYELKPDYKRFVARVGVDANLFDQHGGRCLSPYSSVVFKLFIDGTLVAESPVMRFLQEPWRFDVSIPAGSRLLDVVCMDAGSRNILDYGNWVDAGFVLHD